MSRIELQTPSLSERSAYCCAGAAAFMLLYGGVSALSLPPLAIDLSFEPDWRFIPQFAPLYLSVLLPLTLLPFLAEDRQELQSLASVYLLELALSCAFFILAPLPQIPQPPPAAGIWAELFAILDFCNMHGNYFPSLHVAFAVTIANFLGRRGGLQRKIFMALWAALVAVSTLALHQHYVIDAAAGAVLGQAAFSAVFSRKLRVGCSAGAPQAARLYDALPGPIMRRRPRSGRPGQANRTISN